MSRARRRAALGAVTVAVAASLAAGYVAAGPAGITVVAAILAVLAFLAARAVLGGDETPPPVRHRGHLRRNLWRGERQVSAAGEGAFPAYRRIAANLAWAGVSRQQYDRIVRPMLGRLALRLAADARGAPGGPAANPRERTRALLGEDLWPLADTSAPPCEDSRAPGVALDTIARVVSRLEDAHRAGRAEES